MQENEGTLRDRQRRDRLQRIHRAAKKLTVERGLAGASIDAIAAEAEVSPRTVFNYYECKEDAILGLEPVSVPEDALKEFREGSDSDKLKRTVHLLLAVGKVGRTTGSTSEERVELIRAYPELVGREKARALKIQEILLSELASQSGAGDGAKLNIGEMDRITILLAGAVVNVINDRDPHLLDEPDAPAIDDAVATVRGFLRTL